MKWMLITKAIRENKTDDEIKKLMETLESDAGKETESKKKDE